MFLKIILLLILVVINGIFSATEIAFLSLNKYDLYKRLKRKDKKASKVLNLINDSSTFLSAIQIAITLSGFLASAFAAENFASEISALLPITMISEEAMTSILIVVITMILSYFTLVFGELIPKKIGLAYCSEISFAMVDVINFVIVVFKPFIVILRGSVNFFVKLFHIKEKAPQDEENIKNNIVDSELEEFEKNLLFNVFDFNDKTVKEAMTPEKDIIFLNQDIQLEELLEILKKYKYTRFPVKENDNIIGFLNVKDLMIRNNNDFNLKDYIRELPKINSNMIIDDAFLFLRSNHVVIAQVIEKDHVIGIVTVEDIIEEVVGNIVDEYN